MSEAEGKKLRCPKCRRSDQLKMIVNNLTAYGMDFDGCRHTADHGETMLEKVIAFGCECGHEGKPEEFEDQPIKEVNANDLCSIRAKHFQVKGVCIMKVFTSPKYLNAPLIENKVGVSRSCTLEVKIIS